MATDMLIRVTMIAPARAHCGVTDYTRYLLEPLRSRVDLVALAHPDSAGRLPDADLTHIQHQYFLFGGVAPWRNRFRAYIRQITGPIVLTAHEFVQPAGPPHVRAAIRITNRLQFGSRRIRRIIVHTREDCRRLGAAGFGANRIVAIPHGVPPAPALPDSTDAKRQLGLDGKFVVTLFGFLSRRKGHGNAIEALTRAPANAVLLLAGGPHPDDRSDYARLLETQISSAGLTDRARITGYLPEVEVARVMAATDLVIAPFTETSGSGSLAMAFACGKAIGASDIGPHREIVDVAPDALRLVRNEPAHWAELMHRVMTTCEDRESLEHGAREYAATHTYARMADATVDVYRDALAGPVE